jgi:hypothetical protein
MNLISSTHQDSQLFNSPGFSALPHSRILSSFTVQDSQLFHTPGFSALSQSRILGSSTLQDSQLLHSPGFSALPYSRILSPFAVQDSQVFVSLKFPQFYSTGFSSHLHRIRDRWLFQPKFAGSNKCTMRAVSDGW